MVYVGVCSCIVTFVVTTYGIHLYRYVCVCVGSSATDLLSFIPGVEKCCLCLTGAQQCSVYSDNSRT